ncbi:MAG: hypothetical protein SPK65_08120, partial [Succinivibrio dextrinosolvens]|nr:hypothetical protein [Succinivibrio dextrinosolvens]
EEIKNNYRPRLQKIQNRIDGENMNYKRERSRVANAQNQLNDDNRMDASLKLSKLQDYQNRLNAIDEKYNNTIDKFNKEKEQILKQQQTEIENLTSNYVNKE